MASLLDDFARAFNQREVGDMARLLAHDATARVLGAPFPTEEGSDVIRVTSFPHLLEADPPLTASRARIESGDCVLLRTDEGRGPIDSVLLFGLADFRIQHIDYVVAPHDPEQLRQIGRSCGLPTLADEA